MNEYNKHSILCVLSGMNSFIRERWMNVIIERLRLDCSTL